MRKRRRRRRRVRVILGGCLRPAEGAHTVAQTLTGRLIEHRRVLLRRGQPGVHDPRLVLDVVIEVSASTRPIVRVERRHGRSGCTGVVALLPTSSSSLLARLLGLALGVRIDGRQTMTGSGLGEMTTELLPHRRQRRRVAAAGYR